MATTRPTSQARGSSLGRWHPGHRLLQRLLARMAHGCLTVTTPDGGRITRGAGPGPTAELTITRWRALRRIFLGGDIGFAHAWIDGDLECSDLTTFLELCDANLGALGNDARGRLPARIVRRLRHLARANSRAGSRRNILAHYDLGNAFYALWLDRGMQYSAALFENPGQTLEEAQEAKLDRILELMQLTGGERVLEIGCGWGGLAERLAARGCTVTAITLSPAQLAHARDRLDQAGLASRVDLRLQDYRDLGGAFDRIVSIEMIEAVGQAWWPRYFATLRDRLAPGGRILLQAITIASARFESYAADADFIQQMIFPGGMLPSPEVIRDQALGAGLRLEACHSFGSGYATTLAHWRERFLGSWPEIARLGFDEPFRRLWLLYLAYCEAGFRRGTVDVGFYQLSR